MQSDSNEFLRSYICGLLTLGLLVALVTLLVPGCGSVSLAAPDAATISVNAPDGVAETWSLADGGTSDALQQADIVLSAEHSGSPDVGRIDALPICDPQIQHYDCPQPRCDCQDR